MEMNPKKVYIAAAVLVVVGLGKMCIGEEGQGHAAWVEMHKFTSQRRCW